jgi:hypothetical protein
MDTLTIISILTIMTSARMIVCERAKTVTQFGIVHHEVHQPAVLRSRHVDLAQRARLALAQRALRIRPALAVTRHDTTFDQRGRAGQGQPALLLRDPPGNPSAPRPDRRAVGTALSGHHGVTCGPS